MDKSKSDELKEKLEKVNSLTQDELDNYFNKCLFDFEIDSSKKAGLGIIDLRIKSGNPISYTFSDVSDECTFFSLQTVITTE